MQKKQMLFKTKGMNRDLSVSAFNPEFVFENINLRLSTNENNTLMSWVNEKGTAIVKDENNNDITFVGTPIGTAFIDHKLIVFTADTLDRIYVVEKINNTFNSTLIFQGNLQLNTSYPLETHVSYEAKNIQKVYWTDNLNQPRVINIAKFYPNNPLILSTSEIVTKFDFVTSARLDSTLEVEKRISGGVFSPGVIQYCYTCFNKYGQQSNIINVSPLYYLTHSDRGASAEDKVSNSFQITITNPDDDFEMLRIYSIHRTSLDATPIVLALEDFPIVSGQPISFVDTGTVGATVDPTELLFMGGKEILALTMEEKDQTLFLGNITLQNSDVSKIQDYFDHLRNSANPQDHINIQFHNGEGTNVTRTVPPIDWDYAEVDGRYRIYTTIQDLKEGSIPTMDGASLTVFVYSGRTAIVGFTSATLDIPQENKEISYEADLYIEKEYNLNDVTGLLYGNTFTLNKNRREITTFKGGDYYRFGFQLQKYTGEWSEPIFIDDAQNDKYPRTSLFNSKVNLPYAQATLNLSALTQQGSYLVEDFKKVYKRIRPVVVYPTIQDRVTVCQGVLNPTVFNTEDRKERLPFSQPSWFFRPYSTNPLVGRDMDGGAVLDVGQFPIVDSASSTGYYILIVRISAEEALKTLSRGSLDYDDSPTGGNSTLISFYAAFKFAVKMLKNDEEDEKDTEFWDMLYWIPKEQGAPPTAQHNHQGYRGRPWWGQNRMCGCTAYNDTELVNHDRVYTIPSVVTASDNHTLEIVDSDEDAVVEFNLGSESFGYDSDHEKYILCGNYKIYLYGDHKGNTLVNTHYSSIFTDVGREAGNSVKQAEIQGSVVKYETPFSLLPNENTEDSNTQFFVDQSIVTLNSPDLDFDASVQNYQSERLNLRILGLIPITASASYHNIKTSSSKLILGFVDEDEDEDGYTHEGSGFGRGELDVNSLFTNKNVEAGKRLISEYIWDDAWPVFKGNKLDRTWDASVQYLIYPWHASRSLNADTRANVNASSMLKTKVLSHILYSCNTAYFKSTPARTTETGSDITELAFNNVESQTHLQENEFIENLRLHKQLDSMSQDINYYPNIDKTLVNPEPWRIVSKAAVSTRFATNGVLMRYKSGSHAVLALPKYNQYKINILPFARYTTYDGLIIDSGKYENSVTTKTFWGDDVSFQQQGLNVSDILLDRNVDIPRNYKPYDILWLAELYKNVDVNNLFGGKGRQAIAANNWLVGGDAQLLGDDLTNIELKWTEGDTYYQRYDCLKTYPFSTEDPNQIVEILSFMCESHVNLDGRWDRNRGQRDNTMVMPQNFNLINPAYSQKDNFFSYKKSEKKVNVYPNLVTYTKTKEAGADIDQWTNITLASNLDLDGDKGEIKSIQKLNNQLFAFQDSGIAQILYNESVQVSSTDGVPIEIANSQKVQGKRYYSNSIGCSNKHSICNTPAGIYFMDSNDKGIYLFNGQLNNLSNRFGFNTWCKTNIYSNKKWNPVDFEDFVTYYDRQNQDVLFINKDTALAFSEKLGAFTSFYDYGRTPYFCNLDEDGLWLKSGKLWKHREGDYCNFFGEPKSFSTTLVGNPEPQEDKIFTNLEFRASVDGEGTTVDDKYKAFLPFDKLEAWNEYQKGYTNLKDKDGHSPYKHHTVDKDSALLRKFRIWRCDIPRDNDTSNNRKAHPMDRMRNPWLYLKLKKEQGTSKRTEIHDVVMTYFD